MPEESHGWRFEIFGHQPSGRREGLETISSNMPGNRASIKPTRGQNSESFQAGKHIGVLRGFVSEEVMAT